MANTKNWKDIYEEYKEAVAENNDEDLRNKQLSAIKNLRHEQAHIWDGCFDRLSSTHLRWKNDDAAFICSDIGRWDCSLWLLNFDDLCTISRGDVLKARDLLSRKLVHQLGAWMMNSREKFSTTDVHRILIAIEDSVELIDAEFCADVKARLEKERDLTAGINTISDTMEEIEYRPSRLWNEMVKAWADQELFMVGKEIEWCGTVARLSEKTVFFTNGNKAAKEKLATSKAFMEAHPEIEKLH